MDHRLVRPFKRCPSPSRGERILKNCTVNSRFSKSQPKVVRQHFFEEILKSGV